MPWSSERVGSAHRFGANIISLAREEAENVDRIFRAIVNSPLITLKMEPSHEGIAILKQAQALPLEPAPPEATQPNGQAPEAIKRPEDTENPPEEKAPSNWSEGFTDEYLQTIKMNKKGGLIEASGKFLPKSRANAARRLAEERGIEFRRPEYTHSQHRKRQRAQ